ncbi:MAG TPA: phage holin family protein [Burkholderiales bacterium]|nr:phage holin family protein [Burkholderiales bacterium]
MDDQDREEQSRAEPPPGHPLGLFQSVRQLLATFVGIAHTRIELLGTEVEEQVARLTSMLLWTIVSLFLVFTAVVMGAVAVLVAFWDTNRILVAVLLAALFALAALVSFLRVRAVALGRPKLFEATLDELAKDRDRLVGKR